jgi:hypothetical protein
VTGDEIAAELMRMTDEDLRLQQGAGAGGEAYRRWADDLAAQLDYRRVTTMNADRLGEIMDEYGWPTISLVGAEPARRAWLIAQHADRQLDLQRRALELMDRAAAAGQAGLDQVAMLLDRVLINEGRKQIYATQVAGVDDGRPVLWPYEDPDQVDQRRAEVGLPPLPSDTPPAPPAPAKRPG